MESPKKSNIASLVEDAHDKNNQKLIDFLMQSDSENPVEVALQRNPHFRTNRMSKLTKLNLLGLINLSDIICDLKIKQNIDEAIKAAQAAIKEVSALNSTFHNNEIEFSQGLGLAGPTYGIAS